MSDKAFDGIDALRIAITGANRGIGRALALAFAKRGARLLLHARNEAALNDVAAAAEEAGAPRVCCIADDLGDPRLGPCIAGEAEVAMDGLDVLILNAAVLGPMKPLVKTDPDAFSRAMDVNVNAQFRIFRAVAPLLSRSPASLVIWLSSGLGRFGLPNYGVYAASKHAVEGLMKVAAAEHEGEGMINVAMAPGMVQTKMLKAALMGGDTSPYQTPEATAEAFVRFVAGVGPAHNGQSLDIDRWFGASDQRGGAE